MSLDTSRGDQDIDDWFVGEILPLEPALMRFLRRNWPDSAEIADLRQETYIRMYEAARRKRPSPVRPFLFFVARNPALVPEVARTYTAGAVFTPSFIPGFTASLDYYNIVLKNAITAISASTASVKQICEDSGGTSPFCALYVRPLPFSDHTPANFVTLTRNLSLNAALNKLEGLDLELDYGFDMARISDAIPGSVDLRMLANYQPVNETQQFSAVPYVFASLSKGHITSFFNYRVGSWGISLQDRWYSGYSKVQSIGQVYVDPRIGGINYLDVNLDKKFEVEGAALDGYLSIQNIFDERPPVNPINGTNPGLYFMSAKSLGGANQLGYDATGPYFTIGLRANL